MSTATVLREKRANVWAQAKEFGERAKKGEEMSAEDTSAWERALAEVDSLKRQIDNLETNDALERSFAAIDAQTRHVDRDGNLSDDKRAAAEYRAAFDKYLRYGPQDLAREERELLQKNFRAQSAGTSSTGGYTVPQGFWDKVTETLKYYGGVETAGAYVLRTDQGNPLPWPTNDDTSNVGAILSENAQESTTTDLTFGTNQLNGFMYSSRFIKASIQFLQDTAIDAEGFIARKIGQRLGRIWNTHQTTGTATTQPQGIVVGATAGATCAASATVAFDDLIKLEHSVDVAYRGMPTFGFMMNDSTLSSVRRLKDSYGQYLWQPSNQMGVPDKILGKPLTVNNDMASIGSVTKPVICGSFEAAYVIRYVGGIELMRLTERFADYLQVGFLGYGRMDALVQDTAAVKYLTTA